MLKKISIISEKEETTSFLFEEGNVLFLFEISEDTINYFESNKDILRNISDVVVIITSTRLFIGQLRNQLYKIIKSFDSKITFNVISKSQREYFEITDDRFETRIIKSSGFGNIYLIRTNDEYVRFSLTNKIPYRVGIEVGKYKSVFYTGLSGKIYENENPFENYSSIIYVINRNLYDSVNISTKDLFDRMKEVYGENLLNMLILGFKNEIESKYFKSKIHSMWVPKKGFRPTEMNTALEKAKLTSSTKEGEYNEHFASR